MNTYKVMLYGNYPYAHYTGYRQEYLCYDSAGNLCGNLKIDESYFAHQGQIESEEEEEKTRMISRLVLANTPEEAIRKMQVYVTSGAMYRSLEVW